MTKIPAHSCIFYCITPIFNRSMAGLNSSCLSNFSAERGIAERGIVNTLGTGETYEVVVPGRIRPGACYNKIAVTS